ncbi:hypothetical protein EJ04DRAFT_138751 [Polyplosphaeria fusca]|uniref:Uncharacterized protein n=1 Tax=Polyplosphaeria fusca TaxID=682080 RepID=A0A9P4R1K3_9PLEO|nr:hypothetical protein EJ04DRAFT_138751 [Polyplosphaeria fusca]
MEAQADLSDPGFILEWLRDIALSTFETTVARCSGPQDAHDSPRRPPRPITPSRESPNGAENDNPSPTDTDFSRDSVFDKRETRSYAGSNSSATTIDTEHNLECGDGYEDRLSVAQLIDEYGTASISSIDPPTKTDVYSAIDQMENSWSFELEQDGPRIVFIKSCLQCTLAGLPCSRTFPACSRCIRADPGSLCLLRRSKRPEEMVQGEIFKNQEPVLLKVKGQDEAVWEKKIKLFDELMIKWLHNEDMKNWVLPHCDGKRGCYRDDGIVHWLRPQYPGNGLGRETHTTLDIVPYVEDAYARAAA